MEKFHILYVIINVQINIFSGDIVLAKRLTDEELAFLELLHERFLTMYDDYLYPNLTLISKSLGFKEQAIPQFKITGRIPIESAYKLDKLLIERGY